MEISDDRFCSEKDKLNTLKVLEIQIRDGNVDEIMLPWIGLINNLPGIFTVSCCGGHRESEYATRINHGYLIVSLTKEAFDCLFIDNDITEKYRFDRKVNLSLFFDKRFKECKFVLNFHTQSFEDTNKIIGALYDNLEAYLGPAGE